MRIAYNNLIDSLSSTSILASSEGASYPLTNVQDQRLTTKWKTESGASTFTAVFDLGSTVATSVFAILSHNCAVSGVTSIVGNNVIGSSLAWDTSGQSSVQTITYNANAMLSFVSSMTYRYWKFTFSSQTADLSIGRLWIGNYISLSPASTEDFKVKKIRDDVVVYGKGRQKYASIGSGWRRFELSFPETGGSSLTAIQTFYNAVGNHSSFIFCNFDSIRTFDLVEPCYCSIDGQLEFSHSGRQYYTYNLAMEEDL